MHLHGLLPILRDADEYRWVRSMLAPAGSSCRLGLMQAATPYFLASLQQDAAVPVCLVVADPERAAGMAEELERWIAPGVEVRRLAEPDFPCAGDATAAAAVARSELASVLSLRNRPYPHIIVVTSVLALIGAMPSPTAVAARTIDLRRGSEAKPLDLLLSLERGGYERVEYVSRHGEMSARGGIVDVFPPAHESPVRLEFNGNRVESLRPFDPVTQRSTGGVERVVISPINTAGGPASILDYLPENAVVALDDPQSLQMRAFRLQTELSEYLEAETSVDAGAEQPAFLDWPAIEPRLASFRRLILLPWEDTAPAGNAMFQPASSYVHDLPSLIEELPRTLARGQSVALVSMQARRLSELFEESGMPAPTTGDIDTPPPPGSLSLVEGPLSQGWTLANRLTILTDTEVFGFSKQARRATKARPRSPAASLSFGPGDLVVHVDHGIGRFTGLTTLQTGGAEHEYLAVTYLDGDTLYVPTDQVQRVTRYIGGGEHAPALSRLGSTEWESTKQHVRQSARTMAHELIELYARRQLTTGHAFSRDALWQQELEASFPYVETPDQLEAIDAVKHDMESERPMDRLICGDVGYGKTEIALRAAFKAVMDGKQVAVLTPTTVLAQQHFATFTERLGAFPVRTEVLSRFTPAEKEAETLKELAAGGVDICIGTHRLLQRDVQFKDVGLLIIDEEQRFGVMQKESLRSLRTGLDTLTLSATPIPRTLHMALTGIRDMSTMETPPEERLAVRTHVGIYDPALVRQAILRELERGGQAFYVHNRIDNIAAAARALHAIVPEARFAVAHGRMPEDDLEQTMNAFAAGETDVLVATTIIQLGLDMPNANTLIVNQSERLGLTQLYQLRGRVGRGRNQAYAYFFYDRDKELSPQARRRLRTIFEANELGAGLEIALRDLEIRGAGSLLGTRQSGHIAAVGFELYCQMLAEEVEKLRSAEAGQTDNSAAPAPAESPSLDLPVSAAFIPDDYIAPPGTRITYYRRLAVAGSVDEIAAISDEMRDRFGPLPAPVKELLYVARIRALAAAAGVKSITRQGTDLVLVPGRMSALNTSLSLGSAVRVGPTQIRISTGRTGGKWRALLDLLLRKQEGDAAAPPSRTRS